MKTKIEFEKVGDMMIMREGERTRNFEVLSVIGRQVDDLSHVEWDLHECDLPILQHVYQRYCEKKFLRMTEQGYVDFRNHAIYFGFKFEEE